MLRIARRLDGLLPGFLGRAHVKKLPADQHSKRKRNSEDKVSVVFHNPLKGDLRSACSRPAKQVSQIDQHAPREHPPPLRQGHNGTLPQIRRTSNSMILAQLSEVSSHEGLWRRVCELASGWASQTALAGSCPRWKQNQQNRRSVHKTGLRSLSERAGWPTLWNASRMSASRSAKFLVKAAARPMIT